MMTTQPDVRWREVAPPAPAVEYPRVRAATEALCAPLAIEDYVVQSMDDASPSKWHLAHTTWFFETFVLCAHVPGYRRQNEEYAYLFNSYYHRIGPMHRRAQRGVLSRPIVAEIFDYRRHVDAAMQSLLDRPTSSEIADLVTLGLHHEMQHQELILTDVKHMLSCNPLRPVYAEGNARVSSAHSELHFVPYAGGVAEIGFAGKGFCFDNETPRHQTLLAPYRLASRPICNAEYREFIRDGGYERSDLWLADGWNVVQQDAWARPIYWHEDLDREFTLQGLREIDPSAPAVHLSYYEADAFARWAGARLPTEAEWERAAAGVPVEGNFVESGLLHPAPTRATNVPRAQALFGDVWEWTQSAYAPYPGFQPLAGAVGEYNGKFMVNQLVLRGGSCASAASHVRVSYRNFFYPSARWQFSGIRLARDSE